MFFLQKTLTEQMQYFLEEQSDLYWHVKFPTKDSPQAPALIVPHASLHIDWLFALNSIVVFNSSDL